MRCRSIQAAIAREAGRSPTTQRSGATTSTPSISKWHPYRSLLPVSHEHCYINSKRPTSGVLVGILSFCLLTCASVCCASLSVITGV